MDYVNDAVAGMAKTWRNRNMKDTLTEQQVRYYSNLAIQTPTKQSNKYFEVVSITNQEVIESIFHTTAPPLEDGPIAQHEKNSQVYGPLVLVWISQWQLEQGYFDEKYIDGNRRNHYVANDADGDDQFCDTHQAIGLSAGAVSYEANRQGLVTGFCRCFDQDEVMKILQEHTDSDLLNICDKGCCRNEPELIVSIGTPAFDSRHQHQHLNSTYKEHIKPQQEVRYIK